MRRNVSLLGLVALLLLFTLPLQAQNDTFDPTNYEDNLRLLTNELFNFGDSSSPSTTTLINIVQSGDPLYIAPLLDLGYFFRTPNLRPLYEAVITGLAEMSGQDFDEDWQAYFEWASENDIPLPPGYDRFKGELFSALIDPNFAQFFDDVQQSAEVNLLEAVWGGVRVDGIPSLVNAHQITPEAAEEEGQSLRAFCRLGDCSYPAENEYVFGLSIDGDNRAYPLRLLNWHEMFNDVIGTQPLYDAPDGEVICQFRAPTPFSAVAQDGEAWVQIIGESAGCPESGWLENPADLIWQEENAWHDLPDAENARSEADGIIGSVPGRPVMLAYCTLCGSGILYDPILEDVQIDGETVGTLTLEFGSTGMLMRSNKLMYDRNTLTVWNALTGKPAFGPLTGQDIELERLPVVVTDWKSWLETHPDTSVLSLDTGYQRDYSNGGAYEDYFNDPNFIMFPVWQQDTSEQENKEVIFTLLLNDTPKAYPLRLIIPEQVTNDTLAGVNVVVVSKESAQREFFEPGGASVRAYERGEHTFSPTESGSRLMDENGDMWRVTEDALIGPDEATLPRLPGHLAFWFGWYSFYPETLVYEPT